MFKRYGRRYFSRPGDRRKSTFSSSGYDDCQLSDFGGSDASEVFGSEDAEADVEGPTLITVDDGKGGIRHIRVAKPPDTQSEMEFMVETCSASSMVIPPVPVAATNSRTGPRQEGQEGGNGHESGAPTIGEMLRREAERGLTSANGYADFQTRSDAVKDGFLRFLLEARHLLEQLQGRVAWP